MKTVKDYYRNRFPKDELARKNQIWKILCSNFFQQFVKRNSTVMDIGGGYCEFINNIKCKTKIAVDINPDTKKFADKNVKIVKAVSTKIPSSFKNRVDIVFMSNFLEHLSTKEEVIKTFEKSHEVLKKGGKIMIMQPNISLIGNKYWDFIDHKVPLNIGSVVEALEITGFEVKVIVKRFLPYTTKSKFVNAYFLVGLYLAIPQALRPFAGQSFFLATKK